MLVCVWNAGTAGPAGPAGPEMLVEELEPVESRIGTRVRQSGLATGKQIRFRQEAGGRVVRSQVKVSNSRMGEQKERAKA